MAEKIQFSRFYKNEHGTEAEFCIRTECSAPEEMRRELKDITRWEHNFHSNMAQECWGRNCWWAKEKKTGIEKETVGKAYSRIIQIFVEEGCTYQEAKTVMDMLGEAVFHKDAGSFLKEITISEILGMEDPGLLVKVEKDGRETEFYTCPECGGAIEGRTGLYFVCPECGKPVCDAEYIRVRNPETVSCCHCGTDLADALRDAKREFGQGKHFKQFYSCSSCHRPIAGMKERYYICQECGRTISKDESGLGNYCGYCGAELANTQ